MDEETKKMFRGILRILVKQQMLAIVERVFAGQLSGLAIADELLGACLRAGSEAVRLLGREHVTQLILDLCPPREPSAVEHLARDISCLLHVRWDRLGQEGWLGGNLQSELIRLFETRPELCVWATSFVQSSPALDDDALAEPLCAELEQTLKTYQAPTAH